MMHDDSDLVEFMPPKGVVPEDVTMGDTFDMVSTYRVKHNGEICLIQIGDAKMPGYEKEDYDRDTKGKNREGYGNVMKSMQDAMGGGAGNTDMGGGGGY
jgi:hypothetical protein